jgi:hypothetical protein
VLPSGSRVVIDPSALTTELLAAVLAGVARQSCGSFMPGASAGTAASGAVVPVPGFPVPLLGSVIVDVTPGWGSGGSGGNVVLEVSSACVAGTETLGPVMVMAVVSSGRGALTDTVPSGYVIVVGPSGLKLKTGIGSGSSMARMIVV